MIGLASTPKPPYYAVIFTSQHKGVDKEAYSQVSDRMVELAEAQPGYLGVESARSADGLGITVSYWKDLESIAAWKANAEHRSAQTRGQTKWYSEYQMRIALVENEYGFPASG